MKFSWCRNRAARGSLLAAFVLLAGCGGGGGGGAASNEPPISGTYEVAFWLEVGVAASSRVDLQGIAGQPRCTPTGGAVPPGMVLGADCTLQGTPTQPGTFQTTLTFSVVGRNGTATVNASVNVGGPVLSLSNVIPQIVFGQPVSAGPVVSVSNLLPFLLQPGDELRYAVVSGTLPPGITLDAATGNLLGSATGIGTYNAEVGGTLRRGARTITMAARDRFSTYSTTSTALELTVLQPHASLRYGDLDRAVFTLPTEPYQSPTPTISPQPPVGSVVSHSTTSRLPPGLVLDPTTGVLSGTPSEVGEFQFHVVAAVRPPGGGEYSTIGAYFIVRVQGPLPQYTADSYRNRNGSFLPNVSFHVRAGDRITVTPDSVQEGQPGDRYNFALLPDSQGNPVPSWVTVDAATGVVSAAAPSDFWSGKQVSFVVRLTTERNGRTIVTPMLWVLWGAGG
jgi:hypothetical protein